jgi:hypothetical protein
MAQQSLPFDVWFSISAKCLADQEKDRDREKLSHIHNSSKKILMNSMLEKNKPSAQYAHT